MKRLLIGIVVLIVVLVAAALAATLLVDADRFRPQVQSVLSDALGREVTLGQLHAELWAGKLRADDIVIGDDPAFSDGPFVSAQSLALGVELWPLIAEQTLHVDSLTLEAPVVHLRQKGNGAWNFASLGAGTKPAPKEAKSELPPLRVDRLRITDGKLVLHRAGGPAKTYSNVQLKVDQLDLASAFPFSMSADIAGGGRFTLEGTLGPWNGGNPAHTPVDAELVIHDLDLVGAGLVAKGAGVGGVIDINSDIRASKGTIHADGTISARSLQLVAAGTPADTPLKVRYNASWQLDSGRGTLSDSHVVAGAAKVAVDGRFRRRVNGMQLNLRLHGQKLPVDDLQALLPAFGVILPQDSRLSGGTLGLDLQVVGPLAALVIRGPVTLDDSRLAGFSLGENLGTALSLAGIKAPADTVIEHAEMSLKMNPSGVYAKPFQASITGLGTVKGEGGMAADGSLDVDLLVKLAEGVTGGDGQSVGGALLGELVGDSKLAKGLGGMLAGTSAKGIGVHIGGTAKAPAFKLDPSALVGLLGAGLAASQADKEPAQTDAEGGSDKPDAKADKKTEPEDVLKSLLRGALKSGDNKDAEDKKGTPQPQPAG